MKALAIFGLILAIKTIECLDPDSTATCEPVKTDLCLIGKDSRNPKSNFMLYNVTGMPNFAGQKSQTDAINTLSTFNPLIDTKCHSHLRFFLCSVYIPMCISHGPKHSMIVKPCRSLCQKVRNNCEPVMIQHKFSWPNDL